MLRSDRLRSDSLHSPNCPGHCRAQRCKLESCCKDNFEAEKAAIQSYEDGWDRWDGPLYPYKCNDCTEAQEEHYDEGCCDDEQTDVKAPATTINIVKPVERPESRSSTSSGSSQGLWQSRSTTPCPTCGRV
jgi:hypothetical protein